MSIGASSRHPNRTSSADPSESQTRPQIQKKSTRDTIVETAFKFASRDGLHSLSLGSLAKAVGMSKSGLFAHFGAKDKLQLQILESAVERFIESVMKPAFKKKRGEPRIQALVDNWLVYLNDPNLSGGGILISASIELDDRPGPLRDFIQSVQQDLIKNIERSAQIAVEEGHFRPDLDIEQFAWTLYSFVLGYHHFKRMLEDPQAELHLKRSFEGLLSVSRAKKAR